MCKTSIVCESFVYVCVSKNRTSVSVEFFEKWNKIEIL